MQWVAGTSVIKDCIPVAHRYGRYQFGHWGGQVISKIEMIFLCTYSSKLTLSKRIFGSMMPWM